MVGLAGAVLMAASPVRPVQPVGPVAPGWRDDGIAEQPQQLRDGDRDQPVVTRPEHYREGGRYAAPGRVLISPPGDFAVGLGHGTARSLEQRTLAYVLIMRAE